MRRPRKLKCAKSQNFPRGHKYVGSVEYRSAQRWVGTFATQGEWLERAVEVEAQLRSEHARTGGNGRPPIPTVAEFAGVTVEQSGCVVPRQDREQIWPWTHLRGITKEASARALSGDIRAFVRSHGGRAVDSFRRAEAREIAQHMTNGHKRAVRRLFGDILDDELIETNPFRGLGVKQVSRLDSGDFRLITDAEFERLLAAAEASRTDLFALTIKAVILVQGTIGVRPGEIFGMQRSRRCPQEGYIQLLHQVDDRGELTLLKSNLQRAVPETPQITAAIEAAPVLSDEFLFTGPRGGPLKRSAWDRYWNPVRVAAGLPNLEFYELKHRAITHMCTPPPDGLGLSPVDAARIVGHQDAGQTIRKHYLRLDERKAIARFHSASRAS